MGEGRDAEDGEEGLVRDVSGLEEDEVSDSAIVGDGSDTKLSCKSCIEYVFFT